MAAEKKPPSLAKIALAGGWAGSMEILVTYPLEFAKTHLQLQHGAAGTKSGFDRGVVHCLASTVERHGVRGVPLSSLLQLLRVEEHVSIIIR